MVNAALCVTPPAVAVIDTVVVPLTNVVVTVNVALVLPAATVTLAGTLAAVLLLPRLTVVGADTAVENVTVPWLEACAATVDGFSVTALKVGPDGGGGVPAGFTVSVADLLTPAPETEIVTVVGALTGVTEMLKPPFVVPAGIVTNLLIVVTLGLLVEIGSWTSEAGAEASVTVAKEPVEPLTVLGLSVMDAGAGCGLSVSCAWAD